jgi:hypothetical protein
MKIETSWVQPPQSIGGLDHLGTQAPCVLIYGQLLPGITNVTDRARYYSFYPWLIWSYDLRYSKDDPVRFVEFFRRADCLFTLISERHARMTDQGVYVVSCGTGRWPPPPAEVLGDPEQRCCWR